MSVFPLLDFSFFFIAVIIDNPPEIKMLSGYYLKYEQFSHLPSSDTNFGFSTQIRKGGYLAHQEHQPEQYPQHPVEGKRRI